MEQSIYLKTFLCLPNTLAGGKVCLHALAASRKKTCRKFFSSQPLGRKNTAAQWYKQSKELWVSEVFTSTMCDFRMSPTRNSRHNWSSRLLDRQSLRLTRSLSNTQNGRRASRRRSSQETTGHSAKLSLVSSVGWEMSTGKTLAGKVAVDHGPRASHWLW